VSSTKNYFAVFVLGTDKIGIVADITKALFELGANINDSSHTIIGNQFAMLLLISVAPSCTLDKIQDGFKEVIEKRGLTIHTHGLRDEDIKRKYSDPGQLCVIHLYGADKPGIVYQVTNLLAKNNVNIDLLIQTIEDYFPTPKRDLKKMPLMFIARSFDINKPGTPVSKIVGGVLGGALKQGIFKVGDTIEIRPGRKVEREGKISWLPLNTNIIHIRTGEEDLKNAQPGASIALLTSLDPSLVKSDSLSGNIAGHSGQLPSVYFELQLVPHLLDRVVGSEKELHVDPIKKGENLMLNVNSSATVGIVKELGKNSVKCILKRPVCADLGSRVTISRSVGQRWRLIGYGIIK